MSTTTAGDVDVYVTAFGWLGELRFQAGIFLVRSASECVCLCVCVCVCVSVFSPKYVAQMLCQLFVQQLLSAERNG